MRLTQLIDCFLYATAAAVIAAVLVSAARAGELPVDQSQNARIQAIEDALQEQLSAYDVKLNAIESRQDDLESRLAKLEAAAKPSAVLAETLAKATDPSPVVIERVESVQVPRVTQNVSRRYTRSELDAWVRSRYSPSTPLRHGIMARGAENQVWRHLVDHGFAADQVNGLEYWVASALHDARHGGLISPYRSGAASASTGTVLASAAAPAVVVREKSLSVERSRTIATPIQQPALIQRSYNYNCANGNCARPAVNFQFQRQRAIVRRMPVRLR